MDLDQKHLQKINEYLASRGIVDPDLKLEISDHLYSIIEHENIDSELIPADILSLSEEDFDKYKFQKTYQELINIKKGHLNLRNYIRELFSITHLGLVLGTLIIHRIVFFIILPGLAPVNPPGIVLCFLAIITLLVYLFIPLYWLVKPYYKLKR